MSSLSIQHSGDLVEDDFKTWSEVVLVGSSGVPDSRWWFAGEEVNLGRTSVTNGNECSYNYARVSKAIGLTEQDVSELVSSTLVVSGWGRARALSGHCCCRPPWPHPAPSFSPPTTLSLTRHPCAGPCLPWQRQRLCSGHAAGHLQPASQRSGWH